MNKNKLKIAVAMSGGVDSSVAAKILKDQGHDVVGIFLHFWKETPPFKKGGRGDLNFENKCCSAEALLDARRVADKIGIPLYTLNFAKIFKEKVVNNFLDEYKKGRTPNPCVRCNKSIKLGYLIKQAKKLGFDYVASGHYAKKLNGKLYKAKDKNKDQSYFLYTFNQKELAHLLFPLGGYTKPQVRRLAEKFKLPVAEKPESQEICFIPGKSHNEFLRRHLKLRPGKIKTVSGENVGCHQGLPLYTIGQRKGIAIGGTGPYYAAKMDYKKNILYVVNNWNDKLLFRNELMAKNVNWLAGVEPNLPLKCEAVIRYRHKPAKCVVTKLLKNKYQVKFNQAQRAITPGQSAVFYKNDEVIGGGIICQN
ncbi:MAG: tRNA 2-thiouridine(34) synthase MnmA [bacterium]|nr:tRNA 2-thiouridine(34) synthase MnmA [bacterium]